MPLALSKANLILITSFVAIMNNVNSLSFESTDGTSDPKVLLREKRQLLFPNSTLLQFNAGLATHAPLINRTIQINWAFQANFQLPWNRTQVPTDVLLVGPGYTAQAREHHDGNTGSDDDHTKDIRSKHNDDELEMKEKNTGVNEDLESNKDILREEDEEVVMNEARSRLERHINSHTESMYTDNYNEPHYEDEVKLHHVYKFVGDMLSGFGHNGTSCVLRALCQLAAEPLHSDDDEDLLHELSQYLLDPSSDIDDLTTSASKSEAMPYLHAQNFGRHQGDCETHYPDCDIFLVDIFTRVHQYQ